MAEHTINGWPLLSGWGDPALKTGTVPIAGPERKLTLHEEVLPLMLWVAAKYHRRIRKINRRGETFDDWSYSAPRKGNASTQWSDHSSGTAIDINTSREGAQGPGNYAWWAGRSKRLRTLGRRRHKIMTKMLARTGVLMWGGADKLGGSYHTPANYDWQHIAIKPGTSVADVRAAIKRLKIGPDGKRKRK